MSVPRTETASRLELARAIAIEAGELILSYYRTDRLETETKSDQSPVTTADRGAERLLRERIAAVFPQDAILGEEYGETAGTSGYRWILDPIDGTKSFVHGVPLFGTLIGVEREGAAGPAQAVQTVIGVTHFPALGETLWAERGSGAWWIERPGAVVRAARVSNVARLSGGLFSTTSVDAFADAGQLDLYERIRSACAHSRGWSDCYAYALVATGRAEIAVDPVMKPWDSAGLQPIVEEAGGRFTDWAGTPSIYTGNAVASNGLVHPEALRLLG